MGSLTQDVCDSWGQVAQPSPRSPWLLQLQTNIQHISSEAQSETPHRIHSQDSFEILIPQEFCL